MKWIHGALRASTRGNGPRPRFTRLLIESLEERLAPATYSEWRSVIGLPQVQAIYPYAGAGYSVAVLDTDIDYNNPDLGGGFGAGHKVIAGYDFINHDNDPMDDNGNGNHTARITGSNA